VCFVLCLLVMVQLSAYFIVFVCDDKLNALCSVFTFVLQLRALSYYS